MTMPRLPSRLELAAGLLSKLRGYRGRAFVSILWGFAASASSVGLLATAAYLISAASLRPSVAELQVAIVGVRFFGLSRGVFRYLERLGTHSVNFALVSSLRVWLYERLEPLAPAGLIFDRAGTRLAQAVGGLDRLENFYVRVAAPSLTALLCSLAAFAWLSSMHLSLGILWLTGAVMLAVGIPLGLNCLARRSARASNESSTALQAWVIDHLQGLPDLIAFGQSGASLAAHARLQAKHDQARQNLDRIHSLESALSTLIPGLTGLALLAAAATLVNRGQVDRLYLALIIIGGMAAFESLLAMPAAGRLLEESLEEAGRMHELASRPLPVPAPAKPYLLEPAPNAWDLRIASLTFGYTPADVPTLDDFNMQLPPGRKAALLGASGSGKTTLVNLLLRFWDYSQGSIRLAGADLRSLEPEAVRRAVNVLPTRAHIFNTTIRQNLLLARPTAAEDQLWQALETACLAEFCAGLPAGLDTFVGEGGACLSAGERQRLALARFLLHDGSIWILDEPTAHLDAMTAAQVRANLIQTAGSRTLLWITHDLSGLEEMDWIYVLRGGRLAEEGRPQELIHAGGTYARMKALYLDITAANLPDD